jgi:hypothetical protein
MMLSYAGDRLAGVPHTQTRKTLALQGRKAVALIAAGHLSDA